MSCQYSSVLSTKMVSHRTVVVTCNGCAMFSFLPKARSNFLCMKCKLLAVLKEKTYDLEGQVQTLQCIREAEEFLDNQVWEASPPQLRKRNWSARDQSANLAACRQEDQAAFYLAEG